MAIAVGHRQNFHTLQQAFRAGDVALMECQLAATGEAVPVICAANRQSDGSVEFAPFAMLFNGNPYEMLNPPNPEGGFYGQQDHQR
jgi:hypothetical protein